MKSYLKRLARGKLGRAVRNELNIRPQHFVDVPPQSGWSVSDAFLWRTDHGFTTRIVFTDILAKFFGITGGDYCIVVKDAQGKELFTRVGQFTDMEEIFTITASDVGEQASFGYFHVFHRLPAGYDGELRSNISNRCYVGYTKDGTHYSYVHGNAKVAAATLQGETVTRDLLSANRWRRLRYTIQSDMSDLDYCELSFVNPTSKAIKVRFANNEHFTLPAHGAHIHRCTGTRVEFSSKCTFLRPVVFCYRGEYFDAHHS